MENILEKYPRGMCMVCGKDIHKNNVEDYNRLHWGCTQIAFSQQLEASTPKDVLKWQLAVCDVPPK